MKVFYFSLLLLLISSIQNEAIYSPWQTLTEPTDKLRMISISDRNEVFVAGGNDDKVHVYLNQGDNFVSDHTLTDSYSDVYVAEITEDG